MPVTFIGLHFIFMFIGLFEIIISFSLLLLMCSRSQLLRARRVGEWEKGPPEGRRPYPALRSGHTGTVHGRCLQLSLLHPNPQPRLSVIYHGAEGVVI